ncbi:hypothetical protein DFJ74DRAFT_57470 [Hyaloraphidium curvatum]|nr:hypothetical protein DFJ74DRAFT_57470 [Hyaloraphidium curvatum]
MNDSPAIRRRAMRPKFYRGIIRERRLSAEEVRRRRSCRVPRNRASGSGEQCIPFPGHPTPRKGAPWGSVIRSCRSAAMRGAVVRSRRSIVHHHFRRPWLRFESFSGPVAPRVAYSGHGSIKKPRRPERNARRRRSGPTHPCIRPPAFRDQAKPHFPDHLAPHNLEDWQRLRMPPTGKLARRRRPIRSAAWKPDDVSSRRPFRTVPSPTGSPSCRSDLSA